MFNKSKVLLSVAICAAFLIGLAVNPSWGQKKKKNNDQILATCCNYNQVTYQVTPDCCAILHAYTPCNAKIEFQYYNPATFLYETKKIDSSYSHFADYKICPEHGESTMQVRVRFVEPTTGQPFCFGSWIEGITQFSFTINLVNCSKCDCPAGASNWLGANVEKYSPLCPGGGCRVSLSLDIPDSINCYKYFWFQKNNDPYSGPKSMASQLISSFNFCLAAGQNATITVKLTKSTRLSEFNDSACVLTKTLPVCTDTTNLKVPCNPDCPYTPFSLAYLTNIFYLSGCPGCAVRVTYTSRKACGIFQDLQIMRIELMTPPCFGCPIDAIYRQTLGAIVALDRMGFDPKPGSVKPPTKQKCSTIWRVAHGSCWAQWKFYTTNGTHVDSVVIWEPCYNAACCLQPMRVCRDTSDNVTISIDTNYSNMAQCDNTYIVDPYHHDTLYCNPVCYWTGQISGIYPYTVPVAKYSTDEDEFDITAPGTYGIQVNQNADILNFGIRSNTSSEVVIQIFDLGGNAKLKEQFTAPNGTSYHRVNISNLPTGVYLYSVTIGGVKLQTDKFSIVR